MIAFIVYDTVIATLAGTHLAPGSGLTCGLNEQWQLMYHKKDVTTIRRIQDSFECCGLRSVVDRAWPFPDKEHSANACPDAFKRTKSCFNDLKGQEQLVAGLLLLVAVLMFLWKVSSLQSNSRVDCADCVLCR